VIRSLLFIHIRLGVSIALFDEVVDVVSLAVREEIYFHTSKRVLPVAIMTAAAMFTMETLIITKKPRVEGRM
jgi:hypothetical protein